MHLSYGTTRTQRTVAQTTGPHFHRHSTGFRGHSTGFHESRTGSHDPRTGRSGNIWGP